MFGQQGKKKSIDKKGASSSVRLTPTQKEIVYLVSFVHKENDQQMFNSYFHKERTSVTEELNLYSVITVKIIPKLETYYTEPRVMNVQQMDGATIMSAKEE